MFDDVSEFPSILAAIQRNKAEHAIYLETERPPQHVVLRSHFFMDFLKLYEIRIQMHDRTFQINQDNLLRLAQLMASHHQHPRRFSRKLLIIYRAFISFFTNSFYLGIYRSIFYLHEDLAKKTLPDFFSKKANYTGTVSFFLECLTISKRITMRKYVITEEHLMLEVAFKVGLESVKVPNFLPDIPEYITNIETARAATTCALANIVQHEKNLIANKMENSFLDVSHNEFWRGKVYNVLVYFFKPLPNLAVDILKVSMFHWDKWFAQYFNDAQLEEYETEQKKFLELYGATLHDQVENYDEYIGYKSSNLMKLDIKDVTVKTLLTQLNAVRARYISIIKRCLLYLAYSPSTVSDKEKMKLYKQIPIQYYSMVLDDEELEQENIKDAQQYMLKVVGEEFAAFPDGAKYEIFCAIYFAKDEFIKKFRGNQYSTVAEIVKHLNL